jgi:DNA-binding transcriptional ArsR family regulator
VLTLIYASVYVGGVVTTFEIVAEPTRRRMLDLVRDRERTVGELVDALGVSQPGVSRHLRVLREADLVTVRRDAQQRWYRLRPDPLLELDQWLAPYRKLWRGKLDALEDYLEESDR